MPDQEQYQRCCKINYVSCFKKYSRPLQRVAFVWAGLLLIIHRYMRRHGPFNTHWLTAIRARDPALSSVIQRKG